MVVIVIKLSLKWQIFCLSAVKAKILPLRMFVTLNCLVCERFFQKNYDRRRIRVILFSMILNSP